MICTNSPIQQIVKLLEIVKYTVAKKLKQFLIKANVAGYTSGAGGGWMNLLPPGPHQLNLYNPFK